MDRDRRRLLAGGLASGGLAAAAALRPRAARADADDPRVAALLRRGLDWLGGEAAVRRLPVLSWRGRAVVRAGGRTARIVAETVVEPFGYARSRSWPADERPPRARVLEIDGDAGTVERDGARTPMPSATLAHERAQYAVYGLLRLVPLLDAPAAVRFVPTDGEGRPGLQVRLPQAPETLLRFDAEGQVVEALNTAPSPEPGAAPIPQRFVFEGAREGGGMRWFRHLSLAQNGEAYFDLDVERLEALAARRG